MMSRYYGFTVDDAAKFDEQSWRFRYETVSKFILPSNSVLDLCGGDGKLEQYLPIKCTYQCVDITKRCKNAVVADLNKNEFPYFESKFTVVTCLGGLEYLDDIDKFLSFIRVYANTAIITYNALNKNMKLFKNHYSHFEIQQKLNKAGWQIEEIRSYAMEKVYLCKQIFKT